MAPSMCVHYYAPARPVIENYWLGPALGPTPSLASPWPQSMRPRSMGPFIRAAAQSRELVVGQWGLVPFFATTPKLSWATHNARSEQIANKPTFGQAWNNGQRCIIPALSFDEPCWESGANVWWRFWRSDAAPWALAGLYNTWLNKATGQTLESFTMLTINADDHPLMRRMHKPDPSLPATAQDKRSVIAVEKEDIDEWLLGTTEQASRLLRLPAVELFEACPATQAPPGLLL